MLLHKLHPAKENLRTLTIRYFTLFDGAFELHIPSGNMSLKGWISLAVGSHGNREAAV